MSALKLLDSLIDDGMASAVTWQLMGQGLLQIREYAQAIGALRRAIESAELDPEANAKSRFSLAEALFQMGDVGAAVDHFESIARDTDNINAWCNLATMIPGDPRATNEQILTIRQQFADRLVSREAVSLPVDSRPHDSNRPLHIGYVSSFFNNENYMKPVWDLIRSHDRSRFNIHLFADDADTGDFGWFDRSDQDHVHLTSSLSNDQLTAAIRQQRLDVLVDLNAYSVPTRLAIYTQRLATVVAAWFNMYATSALPGIDWIIGDQVVIPTTEECFYTERVARLPQSYLSFEVKYRTPDIAPPPCTDNGYLTFGSLVSQYKITPQVYDAWSRILLQSDHARLVLGNRALSSACNRDYVRDQFQQRGIDDCRIQFLPPADHFEFLKYYDQIDLALDAFPYNGGTTTTEAMWQGVPTLTILGDRWASRTSATLLLNSHLGEFVAGSVDDYINQAVKLAGDPTTPQRLTELRMTMRDNLPPFVRL